MAKKEDSRVSGCVIIDKPQSITSHDVVDVLRRALSTRKIGHCGTLDPMATGLMVLGVGHGTKLLEFLVGLDKTYTGEITFGSTTDSADATGETLQHFDMDINIADVKEVAKKLTGDIEQTPPMVSAVKVDGQRLYKLAREGKEVERKSRKVNVSNFEIEATDDPLVFSFSLDCSSGTYVRVIADDLGKALGGGGHLSKLRRTRIGLFSIDDANIINPDRNEAEENAKNVTLLPVEEMLRVMPIVEIDADTEALATNGRDIDQVGIDGLIAQKNQSGKIVAIYRGHRDMLKKEKVMPQ